MLTFATDYNNHIDNDDVEIASIYDMQAIHDICVSIEEYKQVLVSSTEGTTLLTVLDFFGRIFNSLSTSLTKFWKSVKRGELKKYSQDHVATINSIESKNIDDPIFDIQIDIPSGMSVSYASAVRFLDEVFENLDLKALLISTRKVLNQFLTNVERGNDVTVQVGSFASMMSSKKNYVIKTTEEMKQKFSGNMNPTRKFKSEFKSVGEFANVRKMIIKSETMVEEVQSIVSIESEIERIISDIENSKNVTIISQSAMSLADSASVLAKTVDLFGMSIMNLMAVAHNYTLIYSKLGKKL